MKTLFTILSLAFVLCLFQAGSARANGEAWVSTEPWSVVYSLCADGAGGCAVVAVHTSGYFRIVWFDRKGATTVINDASFYIGVPSPGTSYLPQMFFDKKGWFAIRADIATGYQSIARYNYK